MIVRPARKRRDVIRPAVLVAPDTAQALDDGKRWPLAKLPKTLRAFVSWDDADRYARDGIGELVAWAEEPIRYRATRHGDSHRRRSDAVIVKIPCDTHAAFAAGVAAWADWLAQHDVNPGWSLGGSSMNLLRATLDGPLVTTNGDLPPARWTLGGRQQCWLEPGTVVHGAVQLDLPAAYTHIVGGLRYGGAWRRLEGAEATPGRLGVFHRSGYPILARARVKLPDGLTVGPLHKRPSRRPDARIEELAPTVPYPVAGLLQGLWTYGELEQALEAGAAVRVLEAYVHTGADQPFAPWHEAVMTGRDLDGFGGQLAKATGNALWGQFVIDDRKQLCVQRWNGGYTSTPVQGSSGHQRRAWDVGELVCGQVRAKLYRALRFAGPADLVCAHTDGLWLADTAVTDVVRVSLEEEGWRVKSEAAEMHVLDQQKYRYRLRRARSYQVVCAGVPAARADDTFAELWRRFA